MTFLLFAVLTWADVPLVKFDPINKLEPVPEDQEYFMEDPLAFDFDGKGNYYIADGGAKVIFTWDKSGSFKGTIGKPGQGPGEFVFSGRGPASAFISVVGDKLHVVDPRKRAIHIYGTDGTFQKAIPLTLSRGFVGNFVVMEDGTYMIHRRTRADDKFVSELRHVDAEGKTLKIYKSIPDNTFRMSGSGGNRTFTLRAFNPTMVSGYNRATDEMIVGWSDEPSFEIFNGDKPGKVIKIPMVREDVTKEDKTEYEERFQGSPRRPNIEYPDQKAYYTHLIPLGEPGYLVYHQSPTHAKISGVHLDKNGKAKGRFNMTLGQEGGILASRGRTVLVKLNQDDEFEISETKVY